MMKTSTSLHATAPLALPTIERLVFPIVAFAVAALLMFWPDLISPTLQIYGLAVLVIFLGLPHGALDPWVAESVGLSQTTLQSVLFNVVYLFIAALVVLTWVWLPVTSLLVFLVISAWHFSGDWERDSNRLLRLGVGALLILMPIAFHTENVAFIFTQLSGEGGGTLAHQLAIPAWATIVAMVLLIDVAIIKQKWCSALEYAGLLVLAYAASPLIYFALYFCLLHSPRHLAGLLRGAKPQERPRLFRMAVVYTLLTLILITTLYFLWSDLPTDSLILRLVFIGLAAVTVPHMILIAVAHVRLKH
jgi:Brp/Blh family beta-carotene 15,15'-monooxygenase